MGSIYNLTGEQRKELLFSEEEKKMLAAARKMPVVYDEDCPPLTPEKANYFRRKHARKNTAEQFGCPAQLVGILQFTGYRNNWFVESLGDSR